MMSRKDYVAIAKILNESTQAALGIERAGLSVPCDSAAEIIAYGLAHYFVNDNPNFDRQRFLTAAGLDTE